MNLTAALPDVSPPAAPLQADAFLGELVDFQLLSPAGAEDFRAQHADRLAEYTSAQATGEALVRAGLLTPYQLERILAGTTHGLVFGSYRVLDRLGAGASGVVFLGEHILMRRRVAIKVLRVDDDCPPAILERFYAEMRVLADLHHPNIVFAFDAGQLPPPGPNMPGLLYLVLEYVAGGDLESYPREHGPVGVGRACDWIRQAACGLQEAHDRHLIHRDVKPSNLLLTERGEVKLVDFGLVRQFSSRLTDPRVLLGTPDCMAPEQAVDPSLVDERSDVYGLGASLFWLLTGEPPYGKSRSVAHALHRLQTEPARRVRSLRPDVPEMLDDLVARMLDRDMAKRPPQPIAVMNALLPFAGCDEAATVASVGGGERPALPGKRVLIIDDEKPIRLLARAILEPLGCTCREAGDGAAALADMAREPCDLVLLDLNLPDLDGYEVCRRLRERRGRENFKIIIVSGRGNHDELAEALPLGADDYIPKPFGTRQLEARVQHALRLKDAQDQADLLAEQLFVTNRQLESSLAARTSDARRAEDALLFAMAKMAEAGDGETADHLRRLTEYSRLLARAVAGDVGWEGVVNSVFLEQLEQCVRLHDIGKIGLPEYILCKPGPLSAEERLLVQTHTAIGDRMLEALREQYGSSLHFLGMATAIVRHHHERWDGTGYPDRLAGEAIPAAARLVAVADVYDALRRRRFHKPALGHMEAAQVILQESPGQFDPLLVQAFERCAGEFERVYAAVRS